MGVVYESFRLEKKNPGAVVRAELVLLGLDWPGDWVARSMGG